MRLLRVLFIVPLVVFAGWLLTWHVFLGALWWLAAAVAVSRGRPRYWAALLPVGVLLVPWSLLRYTARMDALMAAVERDGAGALGVFDMIAVYGLNLLMGICGVGLGFPEVAAETLSLTVPHGRLEVTVPSRFPLCVPKIQRLIVASDRGRQATTARRIAWRYGERGTSVRAALALNPATVRLERHDDGVQVSATVPVDYPERARLVFGELGPFEVAVEEGLFHALETRGWLHPYRLTYVATLPDGEALPTACEAWPLRLAALPSHRSMP